MSETLPPSLSKGSGNPTTENSEALEDIADMLEHVLRNQVTIAETLDNVRVKCSKAPTNNVQVSGWAVFWEAAFSIWGLLIVVIICATLTQIFSGQPLFK